MTDRIKTCYKFTWYGLIVIGAYAVTRIYQHLFVDCFLAASLWRKLAYWWGFDDYPKQLQSLIVWGTSKNLNTLSKLCFDVVVRTTTWVIWRFKNRVCFDLKPPRKDTLEEEIKLLSHSWITHRLKKSHPLWIDWIRDPILACKSECNCIWLTWLTFSP